MAKIVIVLVLAATVASYGIVLGHHYIICFS